MDTAVFLTRALLAVVFATAGVGKLLDLEGSRRSLRDFGVPERFASVAGTLLPIVELVTAALLLIAPTAQWGALLALLLLLAFIAGITRAMRQGVAPDCNCFGQIHSAPAGRGTLVRNGVLAALAAFVLIGGPGPALDDWIGDRSGAELVALVGVVAAVGLGAWAFQLWRRTRTLGDELVSTRKEMALLPPGLPVGADAPDFALKNTEGELVTLDDLRSQGHPVMLMFTSPGCGPCAKIFPNLRRWQQSLAAQLTIALVSGGTMEANRELAEAHGLENLLVMDAINVSELYRVRATPSALLVTPDGKIGTTTAQRIFEIEPLVRHALRGGDLTAVSNGSES
jgi:methylamine dehydrogenase accessory protein MauD